MDALSRRFWIGCALWGYKPWVGEVFPPGSRSAQFLRLYGERFTAVEGNTTFYSVPDRATIARWVADTPEGFQFCPKLPKQLTHQGHLSATIPQSRQFIEQMQGLGTRLGPIFAQLPPSYGPTQWDDLAQFLAAISGVGVEIALEVRHSDWFKPLHRDRLDALLATLHIGRVLLDTRPIYEVPDHPQLQGERKKPRVPVQYQMTAAFSLIRYISHPDWEMNLPFLQDWVQPIKHGLQAGRRIYFFVHCPVEARSPLNARLVQQWFERQGVDLPPLPWNELQPLPQQLALL